MKITHSILSQQIDFNENRFYRLIVEEPHSYYDLSSMMIKQINGEVGKFVLSDKGEIIRFQDNCYLYYDYYNFDNEDKKLSNAIDKKVLNILKYGDFQYEFSEINKYIEIINQKLIGEMNVNIDYNYDFSIDKFIKVVDFIPTNDDNLLRKIVGNIDIIIEMKNLKLLVFVGLATVLEEGAIVELIKFLKYREIYALFIEPIEKYKINDIKDIILDKDLCEI